MKKKIIFIFIVSLFSCSEKQKTSATLESKTTKKEELKSEKKRVVIDSNLNEVAQTIGGFKNNILFDQEYSKLVNKKFQRFTKSKLDPISSWRESNLKISNSNKQNTLFYPFAGADFIYANAFFPDLNNYIMVGLEPPGEIPEIRTLSKKDLKKYCNDVLRSLSANMRVGFFLTKRMAIEFNKMKVNGTIHSILFYVARTNHKLVDINYFKFSNNGEIINSKSAKESDGFQIQVVNEKGKVKNIYYCSFNLHNNNEDLDNKMFKWVKAFGGHYTMLKAASYLNHKSYFSKIRNFILNTSSIILQDDSGIPYKYFSSSNWKTKLYGNYTKVIPLFSNLLQKDLKIAYEDPKKVTSRDLPFRIGYSVQVGKTNLQVSSKIK
tara:strand:+ start:1660 stop:2796 length:1137 start_codon:yes stop_codon:yes gene_type:complete